MTTETQELALISTDALPAIFAKQGAVSDLFDRLAGEIRKEVPDITTRKGRDRIASLAHKVSKAKVMVDDYGKDLVAEEKKRLALVDADRKVWRDKCDALRDEIRRPLTEWEDAEAARVQSHKDGIACLRAMAVVHDLDAMAIVGRIEKVEAISLGEYWEEFAAEAGKAKDETLTSLRASFNARRQHEVEQAELARLRAEQAKREQEDRDRRIAEEAAEAARKAAEAAADRARIEAEEKARREREAEERKRLDAELDAERAKAEAERLRREAAEAEHRRIREAEEAERRRAEAVEAERRRIEEQQAQQQRQREAEEKRRQADTEHKRTIHREIIADLGALGIGADAAKALIAAVARGGVRHMRVAY